MGLDISRVRLEKQSNQEVIARLRRDFREFWHLKSDISDLFGTIFELRIYTLLN